MKAVIYCRVSSNRQVREGDGLGGQELSCRQYAQLRGMAVINVFREEGISGGSTDRPEFFRMLDLIKAQKEEVAVIVDDLNRLARDVAIHKTFRALILKNRGDLHCVKMQLSDSPEGEFTETIVAAVGELERKQNKRRVKDRQRARLENGYWVFNNPVGYRYLVDVLHGKILVADNPSAKVIRQAFEKFASNELLAQKDVLNFLRERKLVNSLGNIQKISFEDVKRIFNREIYAGIISYPKWGVSPRIGKHAPIISKKVFDSVQRKLNSHKTIYRTGLERDFPLRGYVACSGCGGTLTASWSAGRRGKYPYYRCNNTKTCDVRPKSIKKTELESRFLEFLESVKIRPEVIRLTEKITIEKYREKTLDINQKKIDLKQEGKKLEDEVGRVVDKIMNSNSQNVIERLEIEVDRLTLKMKALEKELLGVEQMPVTLEISVSKVMEFISKPALFWAKGNFEQKRMVQTMLFVSPVEYSSERGFGTANLSLPFKLLQECGGHKTNLVEAGGFEPPSVSSLPSGLHA